MLFFRGIYFCQEKLSITIFLKCTSVALARYYNRTCSSVQAGSATVALERPDLFALQALQGCTKCVSRLFEIMETSIFHGNFPLEFTCKKPKYVDFRQKLVFVTENSVKSVFHRNGFLSEKNVFVTKTRICH